MKKKVNAVFIFCFLFIIVIPFAFSDKTGGQISLEENRYLASAPKWTLHAGIQTEVENWLNDNVAGRGMMKRIYNYLNVNVLKSYRTSDNYYVDDRVYLINDAVLMYLQHKDMMSKEQLQAFEETYKKVQEYFGQSGIKVCSAIFPHKVDIYPEGISEYVVPRNPISQVENLQEYLAVDESLNMSVLYDDLLQAKANGEQVYYAAYDNSHWNYRGAFIGYSELMKQVSKVCPSAQILSEEDFNISEVLREKVYNEKIYQETDWEYSFKKPMRAQLDMTYFENIDFVSNDPWMSYKYYKNSDSSLPKIIIVGDSYVWMFMLPWIAESFSETLFLHELDADQLTALVEQINPDVIAFAGLSNSVVSAVNRCLE